MLEKKSIHGPNFIDIVIAQYDIEVVITIDEPASGEPLGASWCGFANTVDEIVIDEVSVIGLL